MNLPNLFRLVSLVAILMLCFCAPSVAQNTTPKKQDKKKDEVEIPAPETLTLTTKDNVLIKATFYGGTEGKETVPVILLHDIDGNRTDVDAMAERLQKEHGCAVIIPDLRGHGLSNQTRAGKEIDRTRFKKADYMVFGLDIEACKKILMKKNNIGELNIEMLTVVAIGEINIVATQWCISDWSFPPVGGYKQGQDVKLLVMVSPRKKLKGISIVQSLKSSLMSGDGVPPLGTWIVYGKDSDQAKDSNSIAQILLKNRKKLDENRLGAEALPSKLNGTQLAGRVQFQDIVGKFLQDKFFATKDDFPWQNRNRAK